MQTIQTEVIELENHQAVDPFSVYRRATEHFGEHHAFLAESVAGPAVDCSQSIITIGHLACVCLARDSLRITANPTIRGHLAQTLQSRLPGLAFDNDGWARIDSRAQFWTALRAVLVSSYRTENGEDSNGFVVRLDYDTAAQIENIPYRMVRSKPTLIRLDLYQHVAIFSRDRIRLLVNRAPGFSQPDIPALRSLFDPTRPLSRLTPSHLQVDYSTTRSEYLAACEKALKEIHAGNIYQVQLGHAIHVRNDMPPSVLYAILRERNPAPYMFLHQAPDMTLVGASPENYVRVEGRRLTMRPIAGTLARTANVDGQTQRAQLSASPKENAEHIILVDLCRNDIGRLCEPGTLSVPNLMQLEAFPALYHLVSTVQGTLREGVDPVDVLLATFPAGTMTGAPKIRAMEIIEMLESSPRGPYAGALGIVGFNGAMNMALCIRMASHQNGHYQIRASAGLVSDSDPEREWQETLTKMRLLYHALTARELRP